MTWNPIIHHPQVHYMLNPRVNSSRLPRETDETTRENRDDNGTWTAGGGASPGRSQKIPPATKPLTRLQPLVYIHAPDPIFQNTPNHITNQRLHDFYGLDGLV